MLIIIRASGELSCSHGCNSKDHPSQAPHECNEDAEAWNMARTTKMRQRGTHGIQMPSAKTAGSTHCCHNLQFLGNTAAGKRGQPGARAPRVCTAQALETPAFYFCWVSS